MPVSSEATRNATARAEALFEARRVAIPLMSAFVGVPQEQPVLLLHSSEAERRECRRGSSQRCRRSDKALEDPFVGELEDADERLAAA